MAHRKDRGRKRSGMMGDPVVSEDSRIAREKQKARDLRKTPWWRKKLALGKCHYCGKKTPPSELTMDHVIPLARGGLSEKINLVQACKECNNKKKYLLPVEWDEYMKLVQESQDMKE
jgi:5-methylcytosine-specific restriction enzyme A